MLKLQSYILSQILKTFTFSTVTILLVASSLYSQRYFSDVVEYGMPISVFLQLILATMPLVLVLVLPVTLCASIIFVFNKMTADNEITALRACGISQFTLVTPALLVGMIGVTISYSMTLYFVPVSTGTLRETVSQLADIGLEPRLREQTFNTFGPSLTLYFRDRLGDGSMTGVLINDDRTEGLTTTIVADRALITRSEDTYVIVFGSGSLQQFNRANAGLSVVYFDSYTLTLAISQILPRPLNQQPSPLEYGLHELFNPPPEARDDADRVGSMLAEGHQRLATPVMCLTVALIVGAAMFSGQHRRQGDRLRMAAIGLLVGLLLIAYQITVIATAQFPVLAPLIYAMVAVPGAISTLGLYFSNRTAPGHGTRARRRTAVLASTAEHSGSAG